MDDNLDRMDACQTETSDIGKAQKLCSFILQEE